MLDVFSLKSQQGLYNRHWSAWQWVCEYFNSESRLSLCECDFDKIVQRCCIIWKWSIQVPVMPSKMWTKIGGIITNVFFLSVVFFALKLIAAFSISWRFRQFRDSIKEVFLWLMVLNTPHSCYSIARVFNGQSQPIS